MVQRSSPAHSHSSRALSPHEEALQSLCKHILKSRLFRGYYEERRYVDTVTGYRDIVALQRSERDLEKLLLDIRQKLELFHQQTPNIWIGITNGGIPTPAGALETNIWAELDDLAFGQYWFSIKNVRFRDNEILLKLKMVRPVESEALETPRRRRVSSTSATRQAIMENPTAGAATIVEESTAAVSVPTLNADIALQDFVEILRNWGDSIKRTAYDFMSNDISKDNIKGFLKFLGLLIVSIVSGGLVAIKFLGVFALRLLFELSRLTHVLTPIIIKLIDVFNKIVGGFYILLAMIWKDVVVNRGRKPNTAPAIEYNRPMYRSIEYNVRQNQGPRDPGLERNFQ